MVESPVIARANHSRRIHRRREEGRKPGRAMDGIRNEARFSPGSKGGKGGNVYRINRIGGELQIGFYDLHFVHAQNRIKNIYDNLSFAGRRRKVERSGFVWAIELSYRIRVTNVSVRLN